MTRPTAHRLPIVIIGGFLGSGKTTLVNQLLSNADGRRLVVFVNDFGAINIDFALIETVEQDRISLKNGCVCCSLNEDLVLAVTDFSDAESPPDGIIIEASGVADPNALNSSFDLLEAAGKARIDARIYVLDADGFGSLNYEESETIIDHATASDFVLLNKTDLAIPEKLEALERLLGESAPYSSVLKTEFCSISPDLVLGETRSPLPDTAEREKLAGNRHHIRDYQQWSTDTDLLIDRSRFEEFARRLPQYCLRAKGFVRFYDAPEELATFNLVGFRASLETLDQAPPQIRSQLVFIGRRDQMSRDDLKREFGNTLHRPENQVRESPSRSLHA